MESWKDDLQGKRSPYKQHGRDAGCVVCQLRSADREVPVIRLGLRGEYLYKYRAENKDVNADPFSWLPSVSLSYEPNDAINLNFYFRRSTIHPTISERDPILHYVNKYEYMRGNPDLKSYIENEIALRLRAALSFFCGIGIRLCEESDHHDG